ncbi:hypothetical protein [Aeromonas schubertii]|uniref:Uncharacterized protein n=1 Tax=Aeromonas schubertii TaxID=652 RepID=A0A0S2SLY2_9GAMM|nr:hypothetical protein [Aeromonas schubertii]ALP42712.1 hypothetical protein WL1483_3293 [Aeromonas schubertii]
MGRANLLAGTLLLLYPLLVYLSVVSGRGEWLPLLLLPLFAIRLIAGLAMGHALARGHRPAAGGAEPLVSRA